MNEGPALELVLATLPAGTRELLEVMMQSGQYAYKSAYLRGLLERGRSEGREEGRVEGTRGALLAVLAARARIIASMPGLHDHVRAGVR